MNLTWIIFCLPFLEFKLPDNCFVIFLDSYTPRAPKRVWYIVGVYEIFVEGSG